MWCVFFFLYSFVFSAPRSSFYSLGDFFSWCCCAIAIPLCSFTSMLGVSEWVKESQIEEKQLLHTKYKQHSIRTAAVVLRLSVIWFVIALCLVLLYRISTFLRFHLFSTLYFFGFLCSLCISVSVCVFLIDIWNENGKESVTFIPVRLMCTYMYVYASIWRTDISVSACWTMSICWYFQIYVKANAIKGLIESHKRNVPTFLHCISVTILG